MYRPTIIGIGYCLPTIVFPPVEVHKNHYTDIFTLGSYGLTQSKPTSCVIVQHQMFACISRGCLLLAKFDFFPGVELASSRSSDNIQDDIETYQSLTLYSSPTGSFFLQLYLIFGRGLLEGSLYGRQLE